MTISALSKITRLFQGRLHPDQLAMIVEYEESHNELPLAIEILCDQICEEQLDTTEAEYLALLTLSRDNNLDMSAHRFKFLQNLVK